MDKMRNKIDIHFPTLIAISVIAYILAVISYQFLGQAIAVLLVKGRLLEVSSTFVQYELAARNTFQSKYIASAGFAVTFFISGIAVVLLQMRAKRDNIKYFHWVFMTVNLLMAISCFLFSGLTGLGDWHILIESSDMYILWRLMYIFGGFSLYIIAVVMPMNRLNTYIGRDSLRSLRGFYLTFVPFITGSLAVSLPGFLNSKSMNLAFTMGAFIIFGTSAMAWMSQLFKTNIYPPERGGDILVITPSKKWIIAAIILFILYTIFFGFGMKFS